MTTNDADHSGLPGSPTIFGVQATTGLAVDEVIRSLALSLAVAHHGLANFAEKSIPARSETVLHTAKMFEVWIKTGQEQPSRK